jgi:zinc protease
VKITRRLRIDIGVGVGIGLAVGIALALWLPRSARPGDGGAAADPPPGEARAMYARRAGPSGSTVLVEPNRALPLVHVIVALRSGSAWDGRKKDGLARFAAEAARRGAAGQTRAQIDARLDGLGATLTVEVDTDSLRFEGTVLSRHLDAYLAIVADILLRPDFHGAEVARTRRELTAEIDELRNEDADLAARFFIRNLYSDHPYGHPVEGTRVSLERIRREELAGFFRQHVVGPNVVFAAGGDVDPDDFARRVARIYARLPATAAPGPNPLAVRDPLPPQGWRIQLVDKPDRQQAQIMFGHAGVRASHPDYLPLLVAISSFGGHGMKTTLMDEVRTRRGLAYGAYMNLTQRLGRGAVVGWVFTGTDKAVTTLRLALKLYVTFKDQGIDEARLAFTKGFLAGSYAGEMDDPERRLGARVTAEIVGLSPSFVDELPARVRAISAADVRAAVSRHVRAHDLAITIVATAARLHPRLVDAKIQPSAIDVVPYDSY